MLLAGGQGSRLGVLTAKVAKPAVAFGGKYRIIDFPLSNCINSDTGKIKSGSRRFWKMKKEVSDLLHQYSVIIMYKERRSYNANNKTNYRFKKYK